MHSVASAVIAAAIFIFVIIRQVAPRRPRRLRFYILPVIALVIAYIKLPHPVPPHEVWEALISVGISIPFGIMQAYFTTLYQSDGGWLMRGDWRYIASWLALFILHIATTVLLSGSMRGPIHVVEWIAALEIAVVWGLRSLVLHLRYPILRQVLAQS